MTDVPVVSPVVAPQSDAATPFKAGNVMTSPQKYSDLDVLTALIESVATDPAPAVVEDAPAPVPTGRREKDLTWDAKCGCFV